MTLELTNTEANNAEAINSVDYNVYTASRYADVVLGKKEDIDLQNNGKFWDYLRDAAMILGKTDYIQLTEAELKEICNDFVNDFL